MIRKEIMDNIRKQIAELNVSVDAKKMLETALYLGDMGEEAANSIPNVLIVAPPGVGLTSFSHIYSEIIDCSGKYKIRGVNTFLELDFPYAVSELEYSKFFDSPRVISETQNKFLGTFVISFERYDKKNLLESIPFDRLCSFVLENKDNISFVFHVTPEFDRVDEFGKILGQLVDIKKIEFGEPDCEVLTAYFVHEILNNNTGIKWKDVWTDVVKDKFIVKACDNEGFRGYRTMDVLVRRFQYEWAEVMRCIVTEEKNEDRIFNDVMDRMIEWVSKPNSSKSSIGFRV